MARRQILNSADFFAERATAVSLKLEAGTPIGGGWAGGNRPSVEWDDHFVGTNETEPLSNKLVGHVGIGLVRIEQGGTVLEFRPLLFKSGKFGLALLQCAMIAAPRQIPFGPAIAWPANVPTTMSASAGAAERRISPRLREVPPMEKERITKVHNAQAKK